MNAALERALTLMSTYKTSGFTRETALTTAKFVIVGADDVLEQAAKHKYDGEPLPREDAPENGRSTPEEAKFAEEIRKTLTDPPDVAVGSQEKVRPMRSGAVNSSSTDYADVSWNVPAVSMTGATFAPGVPAHSWQATACAGSTIGVKGMMVAAKSMALTTVDLFTDPTHIQKAKAEFDQKRGPNFVYKTRLADRKPALDYRK